MQKLTILIDMDNIPPSDLGALVASLTATHSDVTLKCDQFIQYDAYDDGPLVLMHIDVTAADEWTLDDIVSTLQLLEKRQPEVFKHVRMSQDAQDTCDLIISLYHAAYPEAIICQ